MFWNNAYLVMMFSFCSLKNPFEEHTCFGLAILFMSPKLNQHQILESGHKRGHELSTRSSAVVQETMPNWSGSSGADFFWKSHAKEQ